MTQNARVFLAALGFALAATGACATGDSPGPNAACPPACSADGAGHDSPEEALKRFTRGWNDADFERVYETFAPPRRPALLSVSADVERQMRVWTLTDFDVDTVCHPRGSYWKTASVTRVPRRNFAETGAPPEEREIVWLRLDPDTGWWLYSL